MSGAADDRERGGRRIAILLAIAAVLLNAPFIGWGTPQATAPDRTLTFATDDVLPLGPLAEMHNTFVESKPDRNYAYPWWHYFVLAGAQAPYVGWMLATGGMESPTPTFPFGFQDPVAALHALTLIGRAMSVLMGAGIVICAYVLSRELWGERAGRIAGLLALTNPWLAFYSRTGNLDVPAIFWSSLGLVAFARILRGGFTTRRGVWLGIFAGVAMATKDQALALFLPLAVVLVLPRFSRDERGGYPLRPALAGLLASIVAFAVCTGMVVDPMRQITHVRRLFFDQGTLTAAHLYWTHLEPSFENALVLAAGFGAVLAEALTWPALLAAILGVVLSLRGRSARNDAGDPRDVVLVLPAFATFVLLTLAIGIVVRRYLVPLVVPLDALAAFALAGLVGARSAPLRGLGLVLAASALLWRGAQTVDLSYAQLHETRDEAALWIAEHARKDDRLEYFGHSQKLPHLPASLASRRILDRGWEWEGESDHGPRVLDYLTGGQGPEFLVVIPDWTSPPGLERSQDCPPEVFEKLLSGATGYGLALEVEQRHLLPAPFRRPVLDSPCVSPPVRIFARPDVLRRR